MLLVTLEDGCRMWVRPDTIVAIAELPSLTKDRYGLHSRISFTRGGSIDVQESDMNIVSSLKVIG